MKFFSCSELFSNQYKDKNNEENDETRSEKRILETIILFI